jgi:2-dehydropantoate 2-reductase
MQVTIIGAGAIGGVTGALLTKAGHDVTLVDREQAHVDAINRSGLRISGCRGDFTVPMRAITPEQLATHAATHAGEPLRFVCLAVKAHHTEQALEPLIPRLAPDGFVISLQNGFNEEVIAERIGVERTVGCFLHFGADYQEPGHILLAYDYPFFIGELDGYYKPRLSQIKSVLDAAMPTVITNNLWGYFWGKMGYAALAFAIALTDQPSHEVLSHPELRPALRAVVREVARVGRAEGRFIEMIGDMDTGMFLDESPVGTARIDAFWDGQVERGRRSRSLKVFTGIQRDLMVRKRKTEVDAHMGAVMAHARRVGVPTPVLAQVVAMIHEIEDGRRPLALANVRELNERALSVAGG